jgi:UDP-glucose 4-epimerase
MHTVTRLAEGGARVTVVDRRPFPVDHLTRRISSHVESITANITEAIPPSKSDRCDYVIHMAALSHPQLCKENPRLAYETNVFGTRNVLEFARECAAKKVVYAGSAHVYGMNPAHLPTSESDALRPEDTYAVTKLLGEQLCEHYFASKRLKYVSLRIYNSYGPEQSRDFFIPRVIADAREGRILLTEGQTRKDFVYVGDVAEAILLSCLSPQVGVFNIGSGKETSLMEVATYVAGKTGARLVKEGKQEGTSRMRASIGKARSKLGWKPVVGLHQGLDRTIESFQASGA